MLKSLCLKQSFTVTKLSFRLHSSSEKYTNLTLVSLPSRRNQFISLEKLCFPPVFIHFPAQPFFLMQTDGCGCHSQHHVSCLRLSLPQPYHAIHLPWCARKSSMLWWILLHSAAWIPWQLFVLSMKKSPTEDSLLFQPIKLKEHR